MKKIICIIIVVCILCTETVSFGADAGKVNVGKNINNQFILNTFSKSMMQSKKWNTDAYSYFQTDTSKVFINYYSGYIFSFTDDLVPNLDNLSNRARFENDNITIDIFHETDVIYSYINYTQKAIMNNAELNISSNTHFKHRGMEVYCLAWSREKLAKVSNDKNFYVKYDMLKGGEVYTILIKSTGSVASPMKYLKSFDTIYKQYISPEYVQSLDRKLVPTARNWNEETTEFYNNYLSEYSRLKWGIFSTDYIINNHALEGYEALIDYKFPVVLTYSDIRDVYDTNLTAFLQRAYADGRFVELTIQPPLNSDPQNMLFDVLNGRYDSFFAQYAREVKSFGHPVLLRLFNEMNGDWCEYSSYQMSMDTDLVVKLYRYVADFFKDAPNVIFVWNPNGKSFPDFNWNDAFLHYPGDDYVDVLGLTAYNTGNYYRGEYWHSFEYLYNDIYNRYSAITNMPLIITEFSCARKGGYKEGWTRDMFNKISQYPRIKLAVWWNGADYDAGGNVARAYFINDSNEMVDIFKEYMTRYK